MNERRGFRGDLESVLVLRGVFWCCGWAWDAFFASFLSGCRGERSHANEVVGSRCQSEVPVQPAMSSVSCLAQGRCVLQPAEEAFDPLSFLLAFHILGLLIQRRIDQAAARSTPGPTRSASSSPRRPGRYAGAPTSAAATPTSAPPCPCALGTTVDVHDRAHTITECRPRDPAPGQVFFSRSIIDRT